jgi:hypothetical protein
MTLGAVDDNHRGRVRAPAPTDIKDLIWRPWNPTQDSFPKRAIKTGKDYSDAITPADDALAKNENALNPTQDSFPKRAIKTGKDYSDAITLADDALAKNENALYYWLR